ncbi:DNA-binding transcriptional regulator, AcrR family [Amycolatopsis arida]|uniref:DNA-binding transcriptional regulator, AcrR family n=1 Tax=Amycolatopsis arida TaxID=587909 RepID=A0A1I5V3C6_9PSEU|nr:TetR/AcrR family transcriptional regulator [Amycolatopsis arida]TDX91134.1 AcrR family transcriptional regulator [Amycolatopsis arida]SFQ02009.1 DNA-binding transcriptional regulator, AcrR family [Amycolatopsis arida]
MVPNSAIPPRRYESPVRQARAQRTRAHVVATAGRLFAQHGYAGTSMRQIAAAAGVSLETVTHTGRKADLLLAAFRDSFAGSPNSSDIGALVGHVLPEDLSEDVTQFVPAAVARVADGIRRSLGIWRAFAVAAAADQTVGAVRAELAVARRHDITAWLQEFEAAGLLSERDAASRARLADALGLIVSHEAYDHLTDVCGWPHEEYVEWAAAVVLNQLTLAGPDAVAPSA